MFDMILNTPLKKYVGSIFTFITDTFGVQYILLRRNLYWTQCTVPFQYCKFIWEKGCFNGHDLAQIFGTKYSQMDRVNIVEDSLFVQYLIQKVSCSKFATNC